MRPAFYAEGTSAFKRWRRCAVVGNSGHLLGTAYGAEIDAHDVVMRINQAPTATYEKFVGKRTTHRLLNRLWTLAYADYRVRRRGGGRLVGSRPQNYTGHRDCFRAHITWIAFKPARLGLLSSPRYLECCQAHTTRG